MFYLWKQSLASLKIFRHNQFANSYQYFILILRWGPQEGVGPWRSAPLQRPSVTPLVLSHSANSKTRNWRNSGFKNS